MSKNIDKFTATSSSVDEEEKNNKKSFGMKIGGIILIIIGILWIYFMLIRKSCGQITNEDGIEQTKCYRNVRWSMRDASEIEVGIFLYLFGPFLIILGILLLFGVKPY